MCRFRLPAVFFIGKAMSWGLGAVPPTLGYRLYWLALTILYAHWAKSLIMARACKEIVLNYGWTGDGNEQIHGWMVDGWRDDGSMDWQTMDLWMDGSLLASLIDRSWQGGWPHTVSICNSHLLTHPPLIDSCCPRLPARPPFVGVTTHLHPCTVSVICAQTVSICFRFLWFRFL